MTSIERAIELAKLQQRAATERHRARGEQRPTDAPSLVERDSRDAVANLAATPVVTDAYRPPIDLTAVRTVALDSDVLRRNRVLTESDTKQPAENAYRMMRTRVMRQMRGQNWQRLGITAARANEGKTLTAINFAVSVAAERIQPVVLVDLDLRKPRVHSYLGIAEGQFSNLADYLEGSVSAVEDLLISPGIPGLSCMLNSRTVDRSSDLLASPRGQSFLTELCQRLPGVLVVFDLPPLLETDDPLVVAPMVDGLLLVVAEGGSTRNDLSNAAKLLAEFNLIGTVLNKSLEHNEQGYYSY